MNIESLRSLLYPIGLCANLLFALRFFVQWIQSEKKKVSLVPKTFWILSCIGNCLMCSHGFIQLQYPVCLIQALNALIAWRNLNLMSQKPFPLKSTLTLIGLSLAAVTTLFLLQDNRAWMRAPNLPWVDMQRTKVTPLWHVLGLLGMLLFASRFWVQWWLAEKHRISFLGKSFWWTSCIGGSLSLLYFIRLNDLVNILGYSLGLIPYIRNIMLLRNPSPSLPNQIESQNRTQVKHHSLFLFAGEQSGDLLGGKLISALKQSAPISLFGVGGPEMQKAGMQITYPMERFQVMGFSDVLKSLPRLYQDFRKVKQEILAKHPDGVILIDYPDFNMRLAKALRKGGYQGKLIHYVCPSVWAWRKKRVNALAQTLDHLLTILPFEANCFSSTALPVTYVGHPLVAAIDTYDYDPKCQFPHPLISIFPGSRKHEIELNLPIQFRAAQKMGSEYSLAISVAQPKLAPLIRSIVGPKPLLVPCEKRYELMRASTCALATSGTIILELGLHAAPTVVTYQLSPFNYVLGRYVFRIHLPSYTLVNIICEKEVYPEFIHKNLSEDQIYRALQKLIVDSTECKKACAELRTRLQKHDASYQAAQTILPLLES